MFTLNRWKGREDSRWPSARGSHRYKSARTRVREFIRIKTTSRRLECHRAPSERTLLVLGTRVNPTREGCINRGRQRRDWMEIVPSCSRGGGGSSERPGDVMARGMLIAKVLMEVSHWVFSRRERGKRESLLYGK